MATVLISVIFPLLCNILWSGSTNISQKQMRKSVHGTTFWTVRFRHVLSCVFSNNFFFLLPFTLFSILRNLRETWTPSPGSTDPALLFPWDFSLLEKIFILRQTSLKLRHHFHFSRGLSLLLSLMKIRSSDVDEIGKRSRRWKSMKFFIHTHTRTRTRVTCEVFPFFPFDAYTNNRKR